jgi:hypothetical protein
MKIAEILNSLENAESESQLKSLINELSSVEQIAVIRKYLKTQSKGFKVRNDRGTAYGWCIISGSANNFGGFTNEEAQILDNFGLNGYSNCELIKPENLDYWCLKVYKHLFL